MSIREIYDRINELLETTDYPVEIREIPDLEDFLNDEDNAKYDIYDEIAELYDKIMEGDEDIDIGDI